MTVDFTGEPTSDILAVTLDRFDDDTGTLGDGITTDTTLTLSGTATANLTVGVYRDGVFIGVTPVGSDGSWSFADPSELGTGDYAYEAQSTNGTIYSFPSSALTASVVDPPTVAIGGFTDDTGTTGDGITTDITPQIFGTAAPGASVQIERDGEDWAGTTADGNGDWSIEDTFPGAGSATYVARVTDANGHEGASDPLTVTVVDPPTIDGFIDDTGTADDGVTLDDTPTLNGTAPGAATVHVYRNSSEIGTATVAGDGTWSFTDETGLNVDEAYAYTVDAVDASDNIIGGSAPLSLTRVDPPPVSITGFSDDTGTPGDGTTTDHTPLIFGTATPGAAVSISFEGGGTSVVADVNGDWSFEATLQGGIGYQFVASVGPDAFGHDATSEMSVTVFERPTIDDVTDDTGTPYDGITTDTTPTLSGTAMDATTVEVLRGGSTVGTAPVGLDGVWTFADTLPAPGGPTTYQYVVVAKDGLGHDIDQSDPFDVDLVPPATLSIAGFDTDTGTVGDGLTSDATPTLYGLAANGSIVTVDGIPGTATVVDGTWSFELPELAPGTHTFTAAMIGYDGATAETDPFSITVVVPATIDGFSEDTGTPDDGATTDTTPTLSGTADGATSVEVWRGGAAAAGTAAVDANGAWTFTDTLGAPASPTLYHYTVHARDAGGGELSRSDSFGLYLVPEGAVSIAGFDGDTGTPGDGLTSDRTISLFGTAAAGTTVAIAGGPFGTGVETVVDGHWRYDVPELDFGNHEFTASIIAFDGTTAYSDPFEVTVVAAPTIDGFDDDTGTLDDGATTDTTPTLHGTADGATAVQVWRGDTMAGTAPVDESGSWSFTDSVGIADHQYYVSARDAGDGELSQSAQFSIRVLPTGAVSISGFADDTGTTGDGITSDPTPTLSGTATPGATVAILRDGSFQDTVLAGVDGNWTFTEDETLSADTYTYAAEVSIGYGHDTQTDQTTITILPSLTPTLTSFEDDTGDVGDGRTIDTTPTIHGLAPPDAYLIVYRNGDQVADFTVGGDGTWSYTDSDLAPGEYGYSAWAFVNGEGSDFATTLSVTVLPETVVAITGFDENTGSVEDDVTTDPTPTLSGTSTPDATIEILRNGVSQGTTTVDAFGDWSFADEDTLAPGTYTYSADASIGFGHDATTDSRTITIVPEPTGAVTGFSEDTGTTGDRRTVDDTPTIFGTATPGAVVFVLRNGDEIAQVEANEAGWTLGPSAPLEPGSYTYAISLIADPFGHLAYGPFTSLEIEILAAPQATVTGFSTDTGVAGDGITTDRTLTLSGTGAPSAYVTVYRGEASIGTAGTNAEGDWTLIDSTVLDPGVHSFTARATAGGETGPASAAFEVTVVPPQAAITGFTEDTGTLGDHTTSDTTPTLSGTSEGASFVRIVRDGDGGRTAGVLSDGSWTFGEALPVTPGTYTYQVKGEGGGLEGPLSEAFEITVTGMPVATVTGIADDTGTDGDGITTDTTLTVSGTADPLATVTVLRDDTVIGTAAADASGDWSFADPATLGLGDHDYSAYASLGGETGATSADFEVEVVAAPTVTIHAVANDSGTPADAITTDDEDLVLSGIGSPGAIVRLLREGELEGSDTVDGLGAWAITDLGELAPGTYGYTAEVEDAYGNVVTAASFPVTVIAVPTVDIQSITDTGVPGDGKTSDATPTVSGVAQNGITTVTLYRAGTELLGSSAVDPEDGSWSVTVTSPLDLGPHAFSAQGAYLGHEAGAGTSITIVAAPTVAFGPIVNDTGLAGDRVTTDTTPTVTGTATAGATVSLSLDDSVIGTDVADETGAWSIAAGTLALGTHGFTASALLDGETTETGAPLDVTIVAAPTATVATFTSDTGSSGDGKTSDNTLVLSGTATPSSTVEVFREGVTIGSTIATPEGGWSFADTTALALDSYDYTARAIDAYQHVGAVSDALTVEIVGRPTAAITSVSDDTGTPDDAITTDHTLTIHGTATPFAGVSVIRGDQTPGTTTANADGSWSYEVPTTLVTGVHTFRAWATDGNGEVSDTTDAFLVDVIDPPVAAVTRISDDTGTPGDGVTSDRTLSVHGTATNDAVVTVERDGAVIGTATADPLGQWSLVDATTLTPGSYGYTATASLAGNQGTESGSYAVRITDPAASVGAFSTDTGTQGDGITTDRTLSITGTAAAGTKVHVFRDGSEIGTVAASGGGTWTFVDPASLTLGNHAYRAQSEDEIGGLGPLSDPLAVRIVDPPGAARVTAFSEDTGTIGDGVTTDRTLTVSGTASSSTRLHIFRDGAEVGTTMSTAGGNWSFADATTLTPGNHAWRVQADDGAGHLGPQSDAMSVLVVNAAATPTSGADLLIGDGAANVIQAGEGNDTVLGEAGNDTLKGLNGNDSLLGGEGIDRLDGGNGIDTLSGGAGNDSVYGENGNDRLQGDDGNDRLEAGAGADAADGGAGADTVYGGADNDSLFGGTGADFLFGDAGGDRIHVGHDNARDSVIGTLAQILDDTIEGFLADSLAGAAIASDADVLFVTGMTNAQRAQIDGDLLDAQGRLLLPGGGFVTFAGHGGAEVDAVMAAGGVQIWLV